ncbi:PepSY-associated TM helix domain-containing protein [Gallaecimonas xiamenensis]|uniref:PepSY-associated TM helix domain-containing protein n=1 Tax=Gallaecimonas xiamenensis 3-C-1 TaxID=745411 RepID=K2ILQ3_9GAMM|nr:PepSY-associated TM helix domain-containing protein [Gallaecimonas xiamenensis]EKE71086.1 PepSY-associated TM helix domain-containing protein [Gallaecimonas xiamenensis 3-C-1]
MRRTLWKWHGYFGLAAALPLFLIALTGSLLVFKAEIDGLLMPEVVQAAAPERLPLNQLVRQAQGALGDHEILGWQPAEAPGQADRIYVAKMGTYDWQKAFIDPSNGQLLSPPVSTIHYLTDWLLEFHYTFLAGPVGIAVGALVSLLFLALGVTGVILHRHFWKTFFTLRWGKSLRLFLSDLHKMLGISGAPIFLVLGFTGAWWNIDHLLHEALEPDHSEFKLTHRYYRSDLDFDAMLSEARQALPGFEATYIRFPDKSFPGIHLFGHQVQASSLRSLYGSIASFDDQSGQRTGLLDVTEAGVIYQFEDTFKPLHYGTFGGLVTRVLWCIVGFFPCLMALSGYLMWRKRVKR